jgi:hypothetical protein
MNRESGESLAKKEPFPGAAWAEEGKLWLSGAGCRAYLAVNL